MKCNFCGQEMAEDARFCPNCGKEKVVVVETTQPQVQPVQDNEAITKKYGFSGALTATIFGSCSFIGFCTAMIFAAFVPALGTMFAIACTVFSILAIVKGAKAIKAFIYAKNTARIKPVATLVLGIVGVVAGAFALCYGFFCFIEIILISAYV